MGIKTVPVYYCGFLPTEQLETRLPTHDFSGLTVPGENLA